MTYLVSAAPICDGPYEIFEDVYAMNGNPYNEVAMATLEQCQAACAGSSLCVAFDYSQARTPYCWRHLTADNLRDENVAALVANDHYRFNDACGDRRERLRLLEYFIHVPHLLVASYVHFREQQQHQQQLAAADRRRS